VKVVEISTRAWVRTNLTSLFVSPFPNLHTSAGVARNNVMRGSYRSSSSDDRPDFDRSPRTDRRPAPDAERASHTTSVHDFDVVPTEARHGPGLRRHPPGQRLPVWTRDRGRLPCAAVERSSSASRRVSSWPSPVRGREIVVGTATTMRTRRPPDAPPLGWHAVIGDYGLPNHDPEGDWLYGVEIAVHPDYQRRGIATALYRARLALVPELGLEGWYAGGMLMGYHRYADVLTPRAYAERVIAGELTDPTVSMQLHRGLRPRHHRGLLPRAEGRRLRGPARVATAAAAPAKGLVPIGRRRAGCDAPAARGRSAGPTPEARPRRAGRRPRRSPPRPQPARGRRVRARAGRSPRRPRNRRGCRARRHALRRRPRARAGPRRAR
jgi:GNAT superfamily N-acetyltransferase